MRMRMWMSAVAIVGLSVALLGCPPTPPEPQEPTAEILALEVEAFNLINQQRTTNGLNALVMNESMREVARAHSQDMDARNFFDHVNPDGDDPFDRMADAGIAFSSAAENIAANQGFADPAQTAADSWFNSSGHLANIMTADFTETGMGVAKSNSNEFFFTQIFMTPAKDGVEPTVVYGEPIAVYAE